MQTAVLLFILLAQAWTGAVTNTVTQHPSGQAVSPRPMKGLVKPNVEDKAGQCRDTTKTPRTFHCTKTHARSKNAATQSRAGPKSGSCIPISHRWLSLIIMFGLGYVSEGAAEVRVGVVASVTPGAAISRNTEHISGEVAGTAINANRVTPATWFIPWSAKRAYRRARARAANSGSTMHRGRRHTVATLQNIHGQYEPPRTRENARAAQHPHRSFQSPWYDH